MSERDAKNSQFQMTKFQGMTKSQFSRSGGFGFKDRSAVLQPLIPLRVGVGELFEIAGRSGFLFGRLPGPPLGPPDGHLRSSPGYNMTRLQR
jgi:hypothetical protein